MEPWIELFNREVWNILLNDLKKEDKTILVEDWDFVCNVLHSLCYMFYTNEIKPNIRLPCFAFTLWKIYRTFW